MAEQVSSPPVISTGAAHEAAPATIAADEYMAHYAHDFYEWAQGRLIKMSPITGLHDDLTGYLYKLLDTYLFLRPIGKVRRAPFVMQVDATESRREPDLQVILTTNPDQLSETAMIGPADICIEVVSPESVSRDYGEKLAEYEKGGVGEYWLLDPIREVALSYRLGEDGLYHPVSPDSDGYYQSPALPGLRLHVPTLWQKKLPDILTVVQAVQEMLRSA